VALIDKQDPGGTCLYSGCIPTKSLLASTKLISRINHATSLGLSPAKPDWNWASLVERKTRVVESLKKGMMEAIKRARIEWIAGEAKFSGKNRLSIQGKNEIEAKHVIIATGSQPVPFPGAPFDGEKILSSTQILDIKALPKSLLVLGGGVVGVEFASIFQPLGVKVTIVEMLDRLIAAEDEEVSRRLESLFKRKGIEIQTGKRVKQIDRRGGEQVKVAMESGETLQADSVLVAMGRRPCLENLGLEAVGLQTEKSRIKVDPFLETSVPGVFAIGDVTSRSTGLAHGASAEGLRVVDNLEGPKREMNYEAIPNCVYADPEVASVGEPFRPAPDEVVECKILFSNLGKSQVEAETEGFLKMTAAKSDGRVLRVSAIGAHVTELIHEAALAVRSRLSVKDIAETVHAHPTESEILQKAAHRLREALLSAPARPAWFYE
jgi:dihydrolipoamide dehydrogenase